MNEKDDLEIKNYYKIDRLRMIYFSDYSFVDRVFV